MSPHAAGAGGVSDDERADMKDGNVLGKIWKGIFVAILAAGIYATFIRFTRGLGASTHLSDDFPWGLWIGFDILVGVGLAAGGFVIAATVHIFQMERYKPISRPAILTAFLGYLLVIIALLFDLGRPYRIWHPIVMGNPHSVMFEVAICVMLYTTVLALEFSPLLFARLNMQTPLKIIRAVYIPIVILGVLLSTLHQSSLGTLYIIVPDKLYGLWYTPLLPVFFFLSAIAGGLAMTILESFLSARAFGRRLENELLEGIARVIVLILAVLLIWKVQNLAERDNLHLAFQVTQESVMFWGEMLLGVALPMVLFMIPRVRASQNGLFFGAMLTIMGFILNRLNVAITGLARSSGVNYMPSWMEFAITAMIVAVGMFLFRLAVKHLEIFPAEEETAFAPGLSRAPAPALGGRVLLGLWGLTIAGFLILGFSNKRENGAAAVRADTTDKAALYTVESGQLTLPGAIELPTSEDSPGVVTFYHDSHVDARAPNCVTCHSGTFSITGANEGRWLAGPDVDPHSTKYCGKCHNGNEAFDLEDDCEMCHQSD